MFILFIQIHNIPQFYYDLFSESNLDNKMKKMFI